MKTDPRLTALAQQSLFNYDDLSMNCADVCLDHDADCENEFYRESICVARQPHTCCECGNAITPGMKYERVSGKSEGVVWTSKSCLLYMEIRKTFICGSWIFGNLWESIRDGMFPIWDKSGPIDCLAKLDTREARDKCRQQYADWKADT